MPTVVSERISASFLLKNFPNGAADEAEIGVPGVTAVDHEVYRTSKTETFLNLFTATWRVGLTEF